MQASGQALANHVYTNRVYLADYRDKPFSLDETSIAGHLGIGLIQIKGRNCREVLSSPYYRPITKLSFALMERLDLGWCQVCSSLFHIGEPHRPWGKLAGENLKRALDKYKGLIFWNRELAVRKKRLGIREAPEGRTLERRFICADCVHYLLSQFVKTEP